MRTRTTVGAALLALAFLAAACSNGSSIPAGGGGSSTSTSPTPSPSSTGGGGYGYGSGRDYGNGGGGGNGGGSNAGPSVLTLTQSNFVFSPSQITVKAGETITVNDSNPTTSHTFTVAGTNIDVTNGGGESQNVTIDLEPGSYDFFCRFHQSSGMTGTLVVEG
jgi:plastocyanin